MKKVYLRQNIQVEPLINNWYAWIHLISPATHALNLVNRYLNIMESFIASPFMHIAAINDPAMRGGPFIDLEAHQVEDVKKLLASTREGNTDIVAFANAIKELNQLLRDKALGYSLEPLYSEVPDILKGYVELCYDLNNHPTFRLIEPLVYKSPYYSTDNQSIALSKITKDGERPFLLSTPILENESKEHIQIPFKHPALDELFKMKKVPQTIEYISDALNISIKDNELLNSFFTDEKPSEYQRYEGDFMRIRYFGHACILLESKEVSILIDPVLSYTYESDVPRFTYEDLPDEIDYVLITHSHQDHILLETMLQIRHKVKNVLIGRNLDGVLQDPSIKLALENAGFDMVREIRELEEIKFEGGRIMGVPFLGEHHDLFIHSKLGFYIEIRDYSVMALADSCNIEPVVYDHFFKEVGSIDVLFLGMECDGAPASWAYGPLFEQPLEREMDRSRRGRGCNYKEAREIVRRFDFKEVYVYAMGQEPWLRHILDLEYTDESNPIIQSNKLIEECRNDGIVAERLFGEKEVLAPGAVCQESYAT